MRKLGALIFSDFYGDATTIVVYLNTSILDFLPTANIYF